MDMLWSLLLAHPWLALLQAAFIVWMAVDASQRDDAAPAWFWVILLLPVVGSWVYFFAIKIHDFLKPDFLAWLRGRPSLDELRYRAEHMPTLVNHFNLSMRLMEQGHHAEALGHLEAALKMEPEHGKVLFFLARCHKENGQPAQAIPILQSLLAREPRWSNYVGWKLLIDVQTLTGDMPGAVHSCRELARLEGTLENTCRLADHLMKAGQTMEARAVLEKALRDHDFAPAALRRRNRRWAREARRLLRLTETKVG
jgi:hypothetical protein